MKNNLRYLIKWGIMVLVICQQATAQDFNETRGTGSGVNITTGDYNTMYGDYGPDMDNFSQTTSASETTLLGHRAGTYYNTPEITIIGYFAGYNFYDGFNLNVSTTAYDNLFVGRAAGSYSFTAQNNTFVGYQAGEENTDNGSSPRFGDQNTFLGSRAGRRNTTGYRNTFVGKSAGYYSGSGYHNTFIGHEAGPNNSSNPLATGFYNTAVGDRSQYDLYSGISNTSLGDSSAIDLGSGSWNTMIGAGAGSSTESANYNTFVGSLSGRNNNKNNGTDNANRNTYVGYRTGYTNEEGENNVGMGANADFLSTSINRSIFLGAGTSISQSDVILMGYQASSGGANSVNIGQYGNVQSEGAIGMGYQVNIPANSLHSIAIGNGAGSTASNAIAMGTQVQNNVANSVSIGNDAVTNIGGPVNWTATSDGRYKTRVQDNVPGLIFIDRLQPVTYNMDASGIYGHRGLITAPDLVPALETKKDIRYSGFIAQDVEKAAETTGYDFSAVKKPAHAGDTYGLRYAEFVVPLTKALQELQALTEEQQATMHRQETMLEAYQEAMLELRVRVEALRRESEELKDEIRDMELEEEAVLAGQEDHLLLSPTKAKENE